jgi:hypothetical protein
MGDLEQACAAGHVAVRQARATASFRAKHRVALMMAELHRHGDLPEVKELAELVRATLPTATAAGQGAATRPSTAR